MSWNKIVILLILMLSGCTAMKKSSMRKPEVPAVSHMTLRERILAMNMTMHDFNIPRADVEIISNGNNQKLIATLKYRRSGDYLISVKSRAGIEAARIYITKDTIMVNDRMYRKLYVGSSEYLLDKYGIATDLLPLLFGDYIEDLTEMETIKDCKTGVSEIQGYRDNRELWYFLDCIRGKVSGITISEKTGPAGINIKFSDFKKYDHLMYPGKIVIEDTMEKTRIILGIGSVEYDSNDRLEFIPGRNYDKIILK